MPTTSRPNHAVAAVDDIGVLAAFVEAHRRLVVLTGAGCSTESGIPDYRDADGEWKRQPPVQYQDFVRHPHMRQRYWGRSMIGWGNIGRAMPNSAHYALADLEAAGLIDVTITQNVDGLHQKAGSRKVIDLHGRLDTVTCLDCGEDISRHTFQLELERRNPAWNHHCSTTAPDGDVDLDDVDHSAFQVPSCPGCSGILKPCVVFFGESVPRERVSQAFAHLDDADALLVVGSSLMVFSGYRFARRAVEKGVPLAVLNVGRTRADSECTLKIKGRCGDVLPEMLARLDLGLTASFRLADDALTGA